MDRSLFFNKTFLVLVFAVSFAQANDEPKTIADQAKQKTKDALHWYIERTEAMKKEWQDAYARGKVKAQVIAQEVRDRAQAAWQNTQATDAKNASIKPSSSSEVCDTQLPHDISAEAITPAEPVSRTVITITEKEIDGIKQVTSIEVQEQASWIAWLKTDEGQRFGKGALAVITIAGVTYVLYKNRVPQRIYGYVVHNPVESFILGACAAALAAYVAKVNNFTLDSVKDALCVPAPY